MDNNSIEEVFVKMSTDFRDMAVSPTGDKTILDDLTTKVEKQWSDYCDQNVSLKDVPMCSRILNFKPFFKWFESYFTYIGYSPLDTSRCMKLFESSLRYYGNVQKPSVEVTKKISISDKDLPNIGILVPAVMALDYCWIECSENSNLPFGFFSSGSSGLRWVP